MTNEVTGTCAPDRLQFIYPRWSVSARIHACATTRLGGSSSGAYAGFNLASHVGDDPARVATNREQLVTALKLPKEPVWLDQVHGIEVLEIDALPAARTRPIAASPPSYSPSSSSPPAPSLLDTANRADGAIERSGNQTTVTGADLAPRADASLTREPGRVCAVLTADCLPVLLCERHGAAVAAIHAGWRGLLAGVIERTADKLGQAPERIAAWLGPAIGPRAFEVGPEVREAFVRADPAAAEAFKPSPGGRWLADLYRLARQRLRQAGVSAISGGEFCTFGDQARFYSYRRDSRTGRMASLIWLDP